MAAHPGGLLLTALLALALAQPASACDLAAPPDAAFRQAAPDAPNVHVLIELWVDGATPAWLADVLAAVSAREVPITFVARPRTLTGPGAGPARAAVDAGHELALRLDATADVSLDEPTAARAAAKEVACAAGKRPRVAWSPLEKRRQEAVLGQAGMRSILSGEGAQAANPREAAHFENQLSEAVVIPPGIYAPNDGCGGDPVVGPFTPLAADRATVAMQASASTAVAAVRVGLDGSRGAPEDAAVLGRWLDQVILPSGVTVALPSQVRSATLRAGGQAAAVAVTADTGGRIVAVQDVTAAAEALRGVAVLPREIGSLTPTEAFLAFCNLLAGRDEGAVVRLGALSGPRDHATSALTEPMEVDRAALIATANALVAALPDHIPGAVAVGGTTLTAGELLTAMASAVRGDDPVLAAPVGSPDPHDEGLGWGNATVP